MSVYVHASCKVHEYPHEKEAYLYIQYLILPYGNESTQWLDGKYSVRNWFQFYVSVNAIIYLLFGVRVHFK